MAENELKELLLSIATNPDQHGFNQYMLESEVQETTRIALKAFLYLLTDDSIDFIKVQNKLDESPLFYYHLASRIIIPRWLMEFEQIRVAGRMLSTVFEVKKFCEMLNLPYAFLAFVTEVSTKKELTVLYAPEDLAPSIAIHAIRERTKPVAARFGTTH